MTAFTERNVPDPWAPCTICGKSAGLPSAAAAHLAVCGPCAAQQAVTDAAEENLKALTAPMVGAWAAQWSAAGVPLEELEAITEHLTGAWMNGDDAQAYRRKTLRFLRREYAAPVFEDSPPGRVTLHPEDLPLLTGYGAADPAGGIPRPYFLDSEGRPHSLPLGCDSLLLPQPDGSALLIFTGFRGVTDLRPMPGLALSFRVVAGLLPTVQATLAGADSEGAN